MAQRRTMVADDIEVSNPGKVMYPADGLTKNDVVDYYQRIAATMLPHLRDRPLTLRRFPDGIDQDGFFQKEASAHFPDWIRTVDMPRRTESGVVRHVVCDDAATLGYLANQGCLEFHGWLSCADTPDCPDRIVVDLDPAEGVEIADLRAIARELGDLISDRGLVPYVQATGGRGYHVMAPLDGTVPYDDVRSLARALTRELAEQDPDRLTVEQRKDQRGRRIFLDVARNAYAQTAIAPYSLRARPGATVAVPLEWSELSRTTPWSYTASRAMRRLAHKSDPWAGIAEHARSARHLE